MYPCILGRNWRNVEILAALTQRPIPGKFRLFSDLLTYWRKKQTYWTLMTGWLKLLTNCDKILNNVIWIHLPPPPDARRGRGYKNFSILCLRQDVRTDAVTHEILNTFNVDKDKDKNKDKKLFNIVSLPGCAADTCDDTWDFKDLYLGEDAET